MGRLSDTGKKCMAWILAVLLLISSFPSNSLGGFHVKAAGTLLITAGDMTLAYGETKEITAEANDDDGEVAGTFAYEIKQDDDAVISLAGDQVTGVKVGAAALVTIRFTPEDTTVAPIEKDISVTVGKADYVCEDLSERVRWIGDSAEANELKAVVVDAQGQSVSDVVYTSGDPAVIKVADNRLSVEGVGTTTIHMTVAGNENYNEFNADYQISIVRRTPGITIKLPDNARYGDADFALDYSVVDPETSSSLKGSLEIEFTSGAYDVATIDSVGTISLLKKGDTQISVSTVGNTYYDAASSYATLNVAPGVQAELSFEKSGEELQVVYTGSTATFTNVASGGSGTGALSYEIAAQKDYKGADVSPFTATINGASGELTYIQPGEITVKAVRASDDQYGEQEKSYTLTIDRIPPELTVGGTAIGGSIVYDESLPQYSFVLEGSDADKYQTPVLTSEEAGGTDPVISISGTTITALRAGEAVIHISAAPNNSSEAEYADYEEDVNLTIEKKEQAAIQIKGQDSLTYHKDYMLNLSTVLAVTGGIADSYYVVGGTDGVAGEVAYSVIPVEGEPVGVAEITEGKLKLLRTGKFKLHAVLGVKEEYDNKYKPTEADLEITVGKGSQTLIFPDVIASKVTVVYGDHNYYPNGYAAEASVSDGDILGAADTSVEYSYSGDSEGIVADFDTTTGRVVFNDRKTGSITVTAQKAGDDKYEAAEAVSYLLTVQTGEAPTPAYRFSNDTKNGWYYNDVVIAAAAGYQISFDNSVAETANWSDSVKVNDEQGKISGKKVFLRESSTGYVTAEVAVEDFYIDKTAPELLSIAYSTAVNNTILNVLFFRDDVQVTLKATDIHSGIQAFTYYKDETDSGTTVVYSEGAEHWTKTDNEYAYTFTIPAQYRGKLKFTATDKVDRSASHNGETTVVVDNISPVLAVEHTAPLNIVDGVQYYAEDVTFTFKITDTNFDYLEDMDVTIRDNGVNLNIPRTAWQIVDEQNRQYQYSYVISEDGMHQLSVECTDKSGNEIDSTAYTPFPLVLDKTPAIVYVSYRANDPSQDPKIFEENGKKISYYGKFPVLVVTVHEKSFSANAVNAIISVKDANGRDVTKGNGSATAFADYVAGQLCNSSVWRQSGTDMYTAEIPLDQEGDYTFSISCTDLLGNPAVYGEEKRSEYGTDYLTIDVTAPVRQLPAHYADAYSTEHLQKMVAEDNTVVTSEAADEKTRFIYDGTATLSFIVKEANFNAEDVSISVSRDGKNVLEGEGYVYSADTAWSTDENDKNIHTLQLTIGDIGGQGDCDGDYRVTVNYTDRAGNIMEEYVSNVITIDTTAPVITVVYDKNDVVNGIYYNTERKATVTVTDRNILPEDIFITVTAKDVTGEDVPAATHYQKGGAGGQPVWTAGKAAYEGGKPYTWTTVIDYKVDARYTFEIETEDVIGYRAKSFVVNPAGGTGKLIEQDVFVVDKTAPDVGKLEIVYNEALYTRSVNTVLRTISYGYYNPTTTNLNVTVSGIDPVAGIDSFTCTYDKEEGSSNINQEAAVVNLDRTKLKYTEKDSKATASFSLPVTLEGKQAQYRGNISVQATDRANNASNTLRDDGKIVVVDSIAPEWTVEYSPADRITKASDGLDLSKDQYRHQYSSADSEEENGKETDYIFYYKDKMFLTVAVTEANFYAEDVNVYLQKDKGAREKVPSLVWTQRDDVWTTQIQIATEGDYIVTMEYKDRSQNAMKSYVSGRITIDKTVPIIKVSYSNGKTVRELEKIKYYDSAQTATIQITEHNFKAEDVRVKVTAKDAAGTDVKMEDYAGYLTKALNWNRTGDENKAVIRFSTDANYTLEIGYRDLANNEASKITNNFTVDKASPVDLKVNYSTPVTELVMQAITFGFYNAQATVTMEATDGTSGIHHFEYSYLKDVDVSEVNAEQRGVVVNESGINYSAKRKVATASFMIPNSDLRGDNQFNGTIEFKAFDRSEKSAALVDNKRIVVDNISPVADIKYNEPIFSENNISYYAGQIDAVITMTEANFYSEDVNVYISKNGGAAQAISVVWTDESRDQHIGRFSLTEEGDYVVSVNYKDRSENQMEEYHSGQLTIDTKKPVIEVRGIRNRSANRDETIGFILTVEDDNLNGVTLQPRLMAEVQEEDGTISMVDMTEAGNIRSVYAGRTSTYTVNNLERDGIYNLSCTITDRAGNQQSELCVIDSDSQMMEEVRFSVNRNGSTYSLNDETRRLVGTFTKRASNVVVTEINPDELSDIKLTLFKDDKTLILDEQKNYNIDMRGGNGEWYEYIYTIYANNFENDGIYRMSVHSEDAAGNIAENTLDVKNLEISFGVDKTAPRLMVANLENNQTYPVENLTVIMQASDNLKLVSVDVELDGMACSNWEEEEIQYKNSTYEDYSFDISDESTKAHDVIVRLRDAAGNETVEHIAGFYVTTNLLVRFLNNRPLVAGTVAGVIAIQAIPISIVQLRRRKRLQRA